MTNADMGHMDHLEAVAAADVAHLREKERTYQGSWKRGGGRSAWFMLRRKIDRLLVMMSPPAPVHGFSLLDLDDCCTRGGGDVTLDASIVRYLSDCYVAEDVFRKVEADPSGADGTALAEVRDLRRYLLLVEAEMVSQGVVKMEARPVDTPGPPADWYSGRKSGEPSAVAQTDVPQAVYLDPTTPASRPISGVGEPIVQTNIQPQVRVPDPLKIVMEQAIIVGLAVAWGTTPSDARARLMRIARLSIATDTVDAAVSVLQYKWRLDRAGTLAALKRVRWSGDRVVIRTDSNRHATAAPAPPRVERVLDGLTVADYIAVGLHYLPVPNTRAIVDRRQHPELDHLPRLAPELNFKEHCETLAEYRWMYALSDGKYRLEDAYCEYWGREP